MCIYSNKQSKMSNELHLALSPVPFQAFLKLALIIDHNVTYLFMVANQCFIALHPPFRLLPQLSPKPTVHIVMINENPPLYKILNLPLPVLRRVTAWPWPCTCTYSS